MGNSHRSLAASAAVLMLVVLTAMAGGGFLAAALYLVFAKLLPAWGAALVTGSILLVLALLILLIVRLSRRPPRKPRASGIEAELESLLDPQLMALLGRNARSVTLVALLAGGALGASPELRRSLARMARELGGSLAD